MNITKPDKSISRQRLAIRIIYSVFLSLILVAGLILALLPGFGFVPVFTSSDPLLTIIEMIFGGFSLLLLGLGFFLPRLVRWHKKTYVNDMDIFYSHVLRPAFFFSVAIYGLILRILGSSWYIVLPIFILAFAALVLTFPTDKRWAKWKRGQKLSP